ncbi:collagen alpha-1(I) chain-like [Tachyglossus aculeatus]|uniref:collagen alpha-1(I) chain-like n=1 Tax=Tachyglossus aculeatus TaxID=9261 RepID=UPI0018F3A50B|nr:collagen alpha-1(I) chain-like [Tachyglossus aculeatus]
MGRESGPSDRRPGAPGSGGKIRAGIEGAPGCGWATEAPQTPPARVGRRRGAPQLHALTVVWGFLGTAGRSGLEWRGLRDADGRRAPRQEAPQMPPARVGRRRGAPQLHALTVVWGFLGAAGRSGLESRGLPGGSGTRMGDGLLDRKPPRRHQPPNFTPSPLPLTPFWSPTLVGTGGGGRVRTSSSSSSSSPFSLEAGPRFRFGGRSEAGAGLFGPLPQDTEAETTEENQAGERTRPSCRRGATSHRTVGFAGGRGPTS